MILTTLTFQYPAWYLILCLLAGIILAGLLYFRDQQFREQPTWLIGLLGVLRFGAGFLIALLLLTPLLKSTLTETQQPIVVFAQDGSSSLSMEASQKEDYERKVEELIQNLRSQYELATYTFGDEVKPELDFDFDDKVTNLSELMEEMYDLYDNQNLGALIIATDGIFNEGKNPLYLDRDFTAPVYTIALGDTTRRKDIGIKRVYHNRIAYLGDRFNVEVDVEANNCAGANSRLSVYRFAEGKRQKLEEKGLGIEGDNWFGTREFVLDADQPGVQRFQLVVSEVEGENTTVNNVKDFYIDVLDARQKVLILANAPHPDLTALRQSIEGNKNYEAEVAYAGKFKGSVQEYDLVILHQLPSRQHKVKGIMTEMDKAKVARLYIVGMQTHFASFNKRQSLITLKVDGRNTNDVQATFDPTFSSFTTDEEWRNQLPRFAPLTAPFGDFKEEGGSRVWMYQRIGKVDTKYPLWIFGEDADIRTGVLTAEGIWKWRLFDFLQHDNHELFEGMISQVVQYLSVKEDKRRFRVEVASNVFKENEAIRFDAELYNESYELVNEPDAFLRIQDSEGKEYEYTFNRKGNAYSLDARRFPAGDYSFDASTSWQGEPLTYRGKFSVQPLQLEAYETAANHGLLRQISEKYGGRSLSPAALPQLAEVLAQRDIKPVMYQTSTTRPVIHLKWLFAIILFLLALEWFLRRYFGAY